MSKLNQSLHDVRPLFVGSRIEEVLAIACLSIELDFRTSMCS